ncbi:uncharacterized protein LOC115746752 [Rhodamnia argentea]|uniref:Uncharacterized protein LOC115746752 n=1 Tax=Rhodamnia argentea TaxID=178133 RepID=A0A8B8PW56_9MYRT|nr:uncharacterized protein LOC115746752 [Rhodamnia argentea]
MSAVLDSPLVALASEYASFGFLAAANSLWTWIAVIGAAALSFWRIRASASSASVSSRVSEEPSPPLPSPSSREDEYVNADPSFPQPASCGAVEEEISSGASTSSLSPPPSPTWYECDGGAVTKGKFTIYYEEDRREDEPAAAAATVDEAELGGREWWWRWERAVRWRDGERGWYKLQDLRAINGNVVRLWDES